MSSYKKYREAIDKMNDLYDSVKGKNVPDFDLFSIPQVPVWTKYPEQACEQGTIKQRGIYSDDKVRIVELQYLDNAKLIKHTHFGYYEFIYVHKGQFQDLEGNIYRPGDSYLVDGYYPHSSKCETQLGHLYVVFTRDEKLANKRTLKRYVELLSSHS